MSDQNLVIDWDNLDHDFEQIDLNKYDKIIVDIESISEKTVTSPLDPLMHVWCLDNYEKIADIGFRLQRYTKNDNSTFIRSNRTVRLQIDPEWSYRFKLKRKFNNKKKSAFIIYNDVRNDPKFALRSIKNTIIYEGHYKYRYPRLMNKISRLKAKKNRILLKIKRKTQQ